jgi:hypothetical protein
MSAYISAKVAWVIILGIAAFGYGAWRGWKRGWRRGFHGEKDDQPSHH